MAYFGWPISRSIRETVDHIRCITTDYVTVRVGIGGWISGEGQADNGRDSGPPLPLIARTTTRILDDHEGDNNNEDDRIRMIVTRIGDNESDPRPSPRAIVSPPR